VAVQRRGRVLRDQRVHHDALLQSSRFELDHVVASYLFVPSLHPVLGTMEPVLVPGWTLNYEMFFYLIFGGTLLLPERQRMPTLLLVLAALALVGAGYPDTRSVIGFYTFNIVLEFGFGVVIAHLFLRGVRVPGAIAGMVLVAGAAGLAMSSADTLPRVIKWGLPAAMIVIGAIGIDTSRGVARMRLPHFLGDASYSIYLSHGIVLSAFGQAWRKLGLAGTGPVVFTIFATVAACAVGGLLYVLLERPLLKLMQSRPLQRLVAPTSAS
jgi:exopolysaccharide production protein ExoZ